MKRIAEQFRLDGAVQSVATLGEGFINDTYIVTTERARYVLQRKNRNVFTDIPAMMRNIEGVTSFLREKVRRAGGDPRREVMTVIPTHDGALYYEDAAGDYWAATLFIEDSVTCQSASTPELARCGGEGIGRFQRMLATTANRWPTFCPASTTSVSASGNGTMPSRATPRDAVRRWHAKSNGSNAAATRCSASGSGSKRARSRAA